MSQSESEMILLMPVTVRKEFTDITITQVVTVNLVDTSTLIKTANT